MKTTHCIFCDNQIINQGMIYSTNSEYVLYSIRRSNVGRVLVIPRRHVTKIRNMHDNEIKNFFMTIKHVSEILNKELKPVGFNYGLNEGSIAGQTKDHLHFHIIPRFEGDGLMKFHLFHGDKRIQKNLDEDKYSSLVNKFQALFQKQRKRVLG